MRHLIGIGLGIGLVLVMFFAGAWGYLRLLLRPDSATLPAYGGSLLAFHSVLAALSAVAATGLLAGILVVVPRFSPLAPGVPGLLLTGWTVLYLVSVRRAVDLIPLRSHSFGAGWEAMLYNGILGAVGLAMIVPLFVPSRWRRPAMDDELDEDEGLDDGEYLADLAKSTGQRGGVRTLRWPRPQDTSGAPPAAPARREAPQAPKAPAGGTGGLRPSDDPAGRTSPSPYRAPLP